MNKVKGYRIMLNLSQKDTAKALGISENGYSKKERGLNEFKHSEMLKLIELFKKIDEKITFEQIFKK